MSIAEAIEANIRQSLLARSAEVTGVRFTYTDREGASRAIVELDYETTNTELYGPTRGGELAALVALCQSIGLADDGTDPLVVLRGRVEAMAAAYEAEAKSSRESAAAEHPSDAYDYEIKAEHYENFAENLRTLTASPGVGRGR